MPGEERRTKKAKSLMERTVSHHQHGFAREEKIPQPPRVIVIRQQGTTLWSEVRPWTGLDLRPMETAPQSPLDAPRLPQRAAIPRGKAKHHAGGRYLLHFCSQGGDQHRPQKHNEVHTYTEFFTGGPNGASARCPMWQCKPTGGHALKGVTTAVSPSVLALRSEHGRDVSSLA